MSEILILCFLTILSVFFFLIHFYKKYCVDAYRQDLFQVRDDLFNFAAEGGISFDHPAYAMARAYLNGTIRFTERLSLVQLIIFSILFEKHSSLFEQDISNRLKGLNSTQREKISSALESAADSTIVYLVKKNVALVSMFEMVRYISIIRAIVRPSAIKDKLASQYKSAYSDAIYEEGSLVFA
jgi:hypothetical protein